MQNSAPAWNWSFPMHTSRTPWSNRKLSVSEMQDISATSKGCIARISTTVVLLLMATGDIEIYMCLRLEFFRQCSKTWKSRGRPLRRKSSCVAKSWRISRRFRCVSTFAKPFLVHYVQGKKKKSQIFSSCSVSKSCF